MGRLDYLIKIALRIAAPIAIVLILIAPNPPDRGLFKFYEWQFANILLFLLIWIMASVSLWRRKSLFPQSNELEKKSPEAMEFMVFCSWFFLAVMLVGFVVWISVK